MIILNFQLYLRPLFKWPFFFFKIALMIDKLYSKYLEVEQVITTDSRNIPKGCMFFALKGESFDGNKFANEAIKKGAKYAVIDNPAFQGKGTILVENVLISLQKLANHYRNISPFKVIGLTGTNGKTTTKELIHIVLSETYNCSATKGNLNNHIGVPLTILSTPPDCEILIVEMGANHQGEIADLCNIAEPDVGLITNIGRAHLDGFGGFEGVIKAKSELYNYLSKDKKTIFVNSNEEILNELSQNFRNIVKYGVENTICYANKLNSSSTLSLDMFIDGKNFQIETNLFGKYNTENILTAACVGTYFNVPSEKIIKAIESYQPENNRSQIKNTSRNKLILDSYNANPSSMSSALNSFKDTEGLNKVVILGEMKELGNESVKEHNKVVELVSHLKLKNYFFVGNGFTDSTADRNHIFNTTEDLIKELKTNPISDSLIFIKGSRANKLEALFDYL